MVADNSAARSIIRFQDEKDKIKVLDKYKVRTSQKVLPTTPEKASQVMASAEKKGGDSDHFGEYVQKNLKLYEMRTATTLSTHGEDL